jgi:rhamnogalacturonyl hydrolase YesR
LIAALLLGPVATLAQAADASPPVAQPASANRTDTDPVDIATRTARWQLARLNDASHVSRVTGETLKPRAWEQAVFWIGMTALADAGAPDDIREAILDMGRRNRWMPGELPFFADDHAITQAYLWAAGHGAGREAIAPTQATFDRVVTEQPRVSLAFYVPEAGYYKAECLVRWCWCDALFMAPPAMLALSRQTGDGRYRDHAMREWWATTDFLYDPVEKLYYRDSRFFERRDARERKLFWARGNGWVFGGIARSLSLIEADSADGRRMTALFREMAGRLVELQKPDGYWAPSLLAPEDSPPETSGTAFFTYGLAWGINAGILDRARFEPAARKGWAALLRAVQPDGKLGYVQQVSDRPEQVHAGDTQYYGVGAFLLAASEVARLDKPPREDPRR